MLVNAINWNDRYLNQDIPWENGEPHYAMQEAFNQFIPKGTSIIEIGCGAGTNLQWLIEAGYAVTGIDISAEAIRLAQEKLLSLQANAEVYVCDFMHEHQRLNKFPVVFDCAVLHLFSNESTRRKYITGIKSVCETNGFWINISCSQDHADQIAKITQVDPPPRISLTDVVPLIEPDFEILQIKRCQFLVNRVNQGKALYNAWISVFRKR